MEDKKISGVDAAALESVLKTVIAEARKPVLTEEEVRKRKADQEARERNSAMVREGLEQKKNAQRLCSHMRRDGTTRAVYILNGNYLLCQACQATIRPGEAPAGYAGMDIYDTNLFNRLFQLSQPEIFS